MYLVSFYVPDSHLETVKTALFKKGAGKLGSYDCCAWQTKGVGQFRALAGSTPFTGNQGKIHREVEYKVDLICNNDIIKAVLMELVDTHPYEEPAYHAVKITTLNDLILTESNKDDNDA
ncbi:MAG: hypothetical protein JEZ12_05140 [Desulfobacterium sp.]|nr:hypothetical protein [Desulfobacterium sp.]